MTVEIREARRTIAQVANRRTDARTDAQLTPVTTRSAGGEVTAIRFGLASRAPLRATHGALLANIMHRAVTRRLDGGREELMGHQGAATDHRHAHWVPLPSASRVDELDGLLVWAPVGISPVEVAAIVQLRWLSGRAGRVEKDGPSGFPRTTLLLHSLGPVTQVAPELCGPSPVWRSRSPYLPVRHFKRSRGSYEDHLVADVRRELQYRGRPTDVMVTWDQRRDQWAIQFRRHRAGERSREDPRLGFGLELTFPEPVEGPLMLGQLSHFGFGAFEPFPSEAARR